MTVAPLLSGLCDDAALFPPGNAPLDVALPDHIAHRAGSYAALVGPFVFPAPRLDELAARPAATQAPIHLSLTVPAGTGAALSALDSARSIPGVRVVAVEVAVPEGQPVDEVFTDLEVVSGAAADIEIFVEVPRDERRRAVLAGLAATPYAAKFRTGGIVVEAFPDEAELANAIHAVVGSGTPFKATAGLHHAVRNTDGDNGFEQHGFLNVLLATHRASQGADVDTIASVLAGRDGHLLARVLTDLSDTEIATLRARFVSFGTCSIDEPLDDLVDLALISPAAAARHDRSIYLDN